MKRALRVVLLLSCMIGQVALVSVLAPGAAQAVGSDPK